MQYTNYSPLLIFLFHSCIRKSQRDNYKGDPEWWSKIAHWIQRLQETDIKKKGKITLSAVLSSVEGRKSDIKSNQIIQVRFLSCLGIICRKTRHISVTPTSIINFTYILLYKYFSAIFTFIIQVYQNTNISWCETGDIKQSILRSSNSVLFYPKPS